MNARDSSRILTVGRGVAGLELRRGLGVDGGRGQLELFELKEDRRPAAQARADSRYLEPTLFKIN